MTSSGRKDCYLFLGKNIFLLNSINTSEVQPSNFWVGRGKVEICFKKLWYNIADYINKADFERMRCKMAWEHRSATEMVIWIEKFIK